MSHSPSERCGFITPPPGPPRAPTRRGGSGEHKAVQGYRQKLESIREGTYTELESFNTLLERKLATQRANSTPPSEAAPDSSSTLATEPLPPPLETK